MWCKVGDIASFVSGKTPLKSELGKGTYPYFKVSDMNTFGNEFIMNEYTETVPFASFPKGTIIFPKNGGALLTNKKRILSRDSQCDLNTGGLIPFCSKILPYLYNWFRTVDLSEIYVGGVIPTINGGIISNLSVPLPPICEQSRIIQKLTNIETLIDAVESSMVDVFKMKEMIKSRILMYAISGKLVPQDPTDEPAIDLLKRINPDFVACDNSHYENDIPEGWCLAHLGDVAEYGDTRNVDVSSISQDDWVLELEDIEKDTATIVCRKAKVEREINGVRHSFKKGQILYSKLRTYLNKVLIAPEDGFCTTEIVPITAGKAVVPEYLLIVLRSPYFLEYTASCGYGVKMPRLGTTDAKKAVIPVPPLAEQKRIVQKVSDLMEVITSF